MTDAAWFAAGVAAGALLVILRLMPLVVRLYVRAALRRNPWDARLVEDLLCCVLERHADQGQLCSEARTVVRDALHTLELGDASRRRV